MVQLIDGGAAVNAANDRGLTPMIMACFTGRVDIVRLLLQRGCDPRQANVDGEMPLLVCANTDAASEIVRLLLDAGAEVNARTRDQRTPLSAHAQEGRVDAITQLLDAGAIVDAGDDRLVTPLRLAVANKHASAVRVLLQAGAVASRRASDGFTPFGAAIASADEDIVEMLAAVCDPNLAVAGDEPALFQAARRGRANVIRLLIRAGADLDFCHPDVGSALCAATLADSDDALVVLLEAGIPVDLKNSSGAQALHLAAYAGKLGALDRLLAAGADPNALTAPRGTPLRAAAERGHVAIVERLLACGADPSPVDAFNRRPIDDARDNGHSAIVQRLERAARPAHLVPRAPQRNSLARMLPERSDASLRGVQAGLRKGDEVLRAGASSVEAPSMVSAIREKVPQWSLSFNVDSPDPRVAFREVEFVLWRYPDLQSTQADAVPAVPPPQSAVLSAIGRIAEIPYLLSVWSRHSERAAARLGDESPASIAGAMVHPPPRPAHIEPWDWWFRVQVAAALVIARQATPPWATSGSRAVLKSVLNGPADWTNTAAIIALFEVGMRDASTRGDVLETLLEAARRPLTPPVFQHVVEPACVALLEFPQLDPIVADELRARIVADG
ncbi:MAG: ankyrin repeat domain-containing protein [Deltaproteobacteria bacterium]|nr:ankyrin repeat domain-containing protein [Deltaproteobacteria bacterium]